MHSSPHSPPPPPPPPPTRQFFFYLKLMDFEISFHFFYFNFILRLISEIAFVYKCVFIMDMLA